ncbi:hypothetical protein LTR95_001618 [Oleoguttula sp. CCFEE 5521]
MPSAQIDHAMKKPLFGTIPGDYVCTVCQETIYEARSVACGHFFCRMCIRTHLAMFDGCPSCQQTLFSFTSLLVGTLTSKFEAMWQAFLWSIYCRILFTIVMMLSMSFVIYMMYTEWILGAGLVAYGFLMLVIHLTIGFDKFETYCKMLPDPRRFILKIQHVMMCILFTLSTVIAVCELLSFVLSAMVIILKSPAIGTIMEGQIRLIASMHFLDLLVYQCFILIYFHFEPRMVGAVLAAQAEAAPSSAQAMATLAEDVTVQAEEGAVVAEVGGHGGAHSEFSDWEMGPFSA